MVTPAPADDASRLRVLVVEDVEPTRLLIVRTLESEGFLVEEAPDLRRAEKRLRSARPDVVVLDVELPDGSGFDLLREITGGIDVPVVMLTTRDAEVDRVLGLELGAEDYMVKPFFPRELTVRVRRAARRGRASSARFEFPGLTIDLATHDVLVDGRPVTLTGREFDLLAHLAAAPRKVFSREDLLREVWQSSGEWQTVKTVTEHVRRIRSKIEADPHNPRRITTVARAGYRFEP